MERTGARKGWITGTKVLVLLLIAAVSIFVLSPYFSARGTYRDETDYLDEKLANANSLALGSTSISYLVSLLPDDHGTPIANELAKISGYLLAVISAVMLEKFLLTALGFVSFAFIIPIGCLWGILAALSRDADSGRRFREIAIRLIILGLCFTFIIPLGCRCGKMVEDNNRDTIHNALDEAIRADEAIGEIEKQGNKKLTERIGDFFAGLWGSVTEAFNWAKESLSNYTHSVAVMLVTTIAIPFLILIAFFCIVRFLTRKDFIQAVVRLMDGIGGRLTGNRSAV